MEAPFIASLYYKKEIDLICKDIKELCGIQHIVAYLLFNNGEKLVISNVYSHLNDYYNNDYHLDDHSCSLNQFTTDRYYLCDSHRGMSQEYGELLHNKHNLYRGFYTSTTTPECRVIFGAVDNKPIENFTLFHKERSKNFDIFSQQFLHKTSNILKSLKPEIKHSLLLNDPFYIKRFAQNTPSLSSLSNREMECLLLSAQGYSSTEISNQLGISKYTAEDHRKSIIKKLCCKNISHAIYIAMSTNIIGLPLAEKPSCPSRIKATQ